MHNLTKHILCMLLVGLVNLQITNYFITRFAIVKLKLSP